MSTAGTLITPDWPLLVQVTAQLAMAATVYLSVRQRRFGVGVAAGRGFAARLHGLGPGLASTRTSDRVAIAHSEGQAAHFCIQRHG